MCCRNFCSFSLFRRLDTLDERRQLDYATSERILYKPFFDLRKIGLCKNKQVDVVERPKGAVFVPLKWNGEQNE